MPKVDNHNSAFSQFIDKKYNGDREHWPDFEAEILAVVNAKIGRFGMKYLETAWPIDENKPIPSEQYNVIDEPEIVIVGTQKAIRLNQTLRSEIRTRNKILLIAILCTTLTMAATTTATTTSTTSTATSSTTTIERRTISFIGVILSSVGMRIT